jgi:hypothetical protein
MVHRKIRMKRCTGKLGMQSKVHIQIRIKNCRARFGMHIYGPQKHLDEKL